MVNKNRAKAPDSVDVYVGKRIKLRRQVIGMTQDALAAALGLTFQQIQKYESGQNRVTASRLYQIAAQIRVPITFFFEDLQSPGGEAPANDPMNAPTALELVRRFNDLDEPAQESLMAFLCTIRSKTAA